MTDVEKCDQVDMENIFIKLGIQKNLAGLNEFTITSPLSNKISKSGYRFNSVENAVFDNSGKGRPIGNPFSFVKGWLKSDNAPEVIDWFVSNGLVVKNKFEIVRNTKKADILKNYTSEIMIKNNFTMEILGAIKTWLINRGFERSYIESEETQTRIKEVFYNMGYCPNPTTRQNSKKEWLQSKPVLVFPQLSSMGDIIGIKMRKVNNLPEDEETKTTKSINITGSKSGVLFHSLEYIKTCKTLIICEGEADYVCLRMIGFDNVIGNLGGAGSSKTTIRDLVKTTEKIIISYDNDEAGRNASKTLMEYCNVKMKIPAYDHKENHKGEVYNDINDYIEGGYTKSDFENMFNGSREIVVSDSISPIFKSESEKNMQIMQHKNPLIFLRNHVSFYDYMTNDFRSVADSCLLTGNKVNELQEMVETGYIKSYIDLCYVHGGKPYHFNILNSSTILKPTNNPILNEDLKFFIENLCGAKKENYEWIHKAILYKYTHINDVKVPAVVLTSAGGVGKGTFINLLRTIFGKENTQDGLSTKDLISDKDSYSGNKIIVELDELEAGNHKEAKAISARLKNMIFKNPMLVRVLYKNSMNIDNIAWFIISSNDPKPILLDSASSGNRRYSIIEGGRPLTSKEGTNLNNNIVNNSNIVGDYLAWLFKTYPEVVKWDSIDSLDNEEKTILEYNSTGNSDKFFDWFNEKYPDINKINVLERDNLLDLYRREIGEFGFKYDKMYDVKYFNSELPRNVKLQSLRIRGKTKKGYKINRKEGGEFPDNSIENLEII